MSPVALYLRTEPGALTSDDSVLAAFDAIAEPACVVIDPGGTVRAVSHAWRILAAANGDCLSTVVAGGNFFTAEGRDTGLDTDWARALEAGVRQVLSGRRQDFSMDYPCRTPAGERWFEARVQRFESKAQLFVISQQDVTERRCRDEELRRFGAAMEATTDAIFLIDAARMALADVNGAACRLFGRPRADVLAMAPETLFNTPRHELDKAWQALISDDVRSTLIETHYQRDDGSQMPVEVRCHAARVADAWLIVQVVRDITASKGIQRALQRQAVQHGLLARFGQFALENPPLHELMAQAVDIARQGLGVELCRLLEAGPDDRLLIQVAGSGWLDSWRASLSSTRWPRRRTTSSSARASPSSSSTSRPSCVSNRPRSCWRTACAVRSRR